VSRILLVILDGLADRPWPQLDCATPLEAAATPNLDALASAGLTGLMHPLGRGKAPGSELAHWVLFGYPAEDFPGRGLFEARGEGLDVADDDVVFRFLLSAVQPMPDGTMRVVERRPRLPEDGARDLAETVAHFEHSGVSFEAVYTSVGQGILYARPAPGELSPEVTDGDPFDDARLVPRVRPLADAREPKRAARLAGAVDAYMRWAHANLRAAPGNIESELGGAPPTNFLLLKWAGKRRAVQPFERLTGLRGATVSWGFLYRGLAAELGLDHLGERYLEDPADDLAKRLRTAAGLLRDGYGFVHVHTKAPDVAGHTKNPAHKRDVIAKLDEALGLLREHDFLPDDTLVCVTGDHGTPSGTALIHSGDPVPLLLFGEGAYADRVSAFGERACVDGGLGQFEGRDLMPMMLDRVGLTRYLGGRLTPEATLAWPREWEPFRL